MQKTPEDIMREADALLELAQRCLATTADFYRDHGLDPDALAADMTDAQRTEAEAQAEALFRKDLEDVEREVDEEAARRRFAQAGPGTLPRKPRNMI